MFKLEFLVNEEKVISVKKLLTNIGIKKISLIEVKEYDEDNVCIEGYRGTTYVVEFTQKTKLEVIVKSEELINLAINAIDKANIDSEIFIYEMFKSKSIYHKKKSSVFSIRDEYENMESSTGRYQVEGL
jgi:nitrogen regulatory protein P-II 1/nitrogen regulatory protein P-II 2